MITILKICYLLLATSLLVYSYGFVDFNLTLSSSPLVNNFVSWSQQLAIFNRPVSTYIYLSLVGFSFILYVVAIFCSNYKKFPWIFIGIIAMIFTLAYPFLSSDVFKYLFSAKTILLYHANPHFVAPQVFEGDLWLRFMRWIHTPSPYGPIQTILAIPYYLLSFGKFTPMLYLYKLDQLFWYGLTVWVLGRLGAKPKQQLFFALNPLVLYEWLVNSHNDAVMISLAILSLYLVKQGRGIWAKISLLLSIGVKYVTIIFLPLLLLPKKFAPQATSYYLLFALTLAPLLYHYSYQYQPWYVTWVIPFAALSNNMPAMVITAAYSLGALLRYLPFIQIGFWQGSAFYFATLTFALPLLISLYFLLIYFLRHRQYPL